MYSNLAAEMYRYTVESEQLKDVKRRHWRHWRHLHFQRPLSVTPCDTKTRSTVTLLRRFRVGRRPHSRVAAAVAGDVTWLRPKAFEIYTQGGLCDQQPM